MTGHHYTIIPQRVDDVYSGFDDEVFVSIDDVTTQHREQDLAAQGYMMIEEIADDGEEEIFVEYSDDHNEKADNYSS